MATLNQRIINNCLRDFVKSHSKHHGIPGHNRGATLEHELKKYEVALKLERAGHFILIEPLLETGKRPDILVVDVYPPIAYEIMHSEEMKSIRLKRENYPGKIIMVKT